MARSGFRLLMGWMGLLGLDLFAADGNAPLLLAMEPVHRVAMTNESERLLPQSHLVFEKAMPQGVAFHAVVTNSWPPGLVPVFAVEKSGRIELRRRPAAGMESSSEPVFFALPPLDEIDAAKIAGRWECRAVRGNGNIDHLAWEITLDGDRLAGRFDPTQEYRVATIGGGTFRSNRIELRVEYFMDHYVLLGTWHEGRLRGEWRHTDDSERGTWEATQHPARVSLNPGHEPAGLYEWRREGEESRRYATEREALPAGWKRANRPLCRVWVTSKSPTK